MKLVKRYDYQSNVSAETEMTPEGFLKVMARATRVGVLKYKQMDGSTIRELRHPDEVFNAKSMASLALKPVTNNHPLSLLDSESATNHQVGMTGESVRIDSNKYLEIMTVITDKRTIADLENGKLEVSPGYVCELDFTPGVFDGEEYDAIQRNIRYNHLAIVRKGRSGPEVKIRLDADDAVQTDLNQPEEIKKMKMKFGDKEYDVADDVGAAMTSELEKAKGMSKEMDSMKAQLNDSKNAFTEAQKAKEKTDARADGLEAELTKLKKERVDAAGIDVQKLVKDRMALESVAALKGVEKFDAMDDITLKKAVIKTDSPDTDLSGKSDDYINARFDVCAESAKASDVAAKKIGEKLATGIRAASEVMDAADRRQKMIERQQNAWKGEEKKGS